MPCPRRPYHRGKRSSGWPSRYQALGWRSVGARLALGRRAAAGNRTRRHAFDHERGQAARMLARDTLQDGPRRQARQHGCGHGTSLGQRWRVSHIPTAATTTSVRRVMKFRRSERPQLQSRNRPKWFQRGGPCVDGPRLARTFFGWQRGRLQSCLRPIDAAYVAAGQDGFP